MSTGCSHKIYRLDKKTINNNHNGWITTINNYKTITMKKIILNCPGRASEWLKNVLELSGRTMYSKSIVYNFRWTDPKPLHLNFVLRTSKTRVCFIAYYTNFSRIRRHYQHQTTTRWSFTSGQQDDFNNYRTQKW